MACIGKAAIALLAELYIAELTQVWPDVNDSCQGRSNVIRCRLQCKLSFIEMSIQWKGMPLRTADLCQPHPLLSPPHA